LLFVSLTSSSISNAPNSLKVNVGVLSVLFPNSSNFQLKLATAPVEHLGLNSTVNGAGPTFLLTVKQAFNGVVVITMFISALEFLLDAVTAVTFDVNVPGVAYL
jgi:hypothetical protein